MFRYRWYFYTVHNGRYQLVNPDISEDNWFDTKYYWPYFKDWENLRKYIDSLIQREFISSYFSPWNFGAWKNGCFLKKY